MLLVDTLHGTTVKYKTVVPWQMGLFSPWHSRRIISQVLVPVESVRGLSGDVSRCVALIDIDMMQWIIILLPTITSCDPSTRLSWN